MCCLFGLIDMQHRFTGREKTAMMHALATAAEERGTDAAGIAYNTPGGLIVRKSPVPGHSLRFRLRNDTITAMGHTRMTTQGDQRWNRNNHPFLGAAGTDRFALAHNGVIYNDKELRREYALPQTNIETDSYVAVQLIEKKRSLGFDSLQFAAEQVAGSFTFTVLDQRNNLFIVKGDSPLCLVHYPEIGLYLYASTEAILAHSLHMLRNPPWEAVKIDLGCGEIAKIDRRGVVTRGGFDAGSLYWGWPPCRSSLRRRSHRFEQEYIEDLKSVVSSFGYEPEMVDRWLACGHQPEEIEEFLYEM